jgi:dCMP deaminase
MSRPTWDQTFMGLARTIAQRATCPRASVGACLVRDNLVLALGYNGAPRGMPHCSDIGCRIVPVGGRDSCQRTIHAEVNAILNAAFNGRETAHATLYVTMHPCDRCAALIVQAGVARVVWCDSYPSTVAETLLKEAGVVVDRME